ncbi:MAG: SdpI family protein [Clostridia bacterium]|nr:SdpI family protein [Clostridia bacterium]
MKILKDNKWKILICALLTLMPSIVGVFMWNFLLERLGNVLHGGKTFLIVTLLSPVFLLLLYTVCIVVTIVDNKHREQNAKVFSAVLYICPMISLYTSAIFLSIILGIEFNIAKISAILIGTMFLIIGNYIPKCKQNFTIGIKTSITLANEENWNATHRFSGKVWVLCGGLTLISALLPGKIAIICFFAVLICAVSAPLIYSYAYYKKQVKNGTWSESESTLDTARGLKKGSLIAAAIIPVILGACIVFCFTGEVTAELGDNGLTLDATYNSPLVIDYDDIDSIEFRDKSNPGERVFGFGSPRLSVGTFRNDEFSAYTRYSRTDCNAEIIIKTGESTVIFNVGTPDKTLELYNLLTEKLKGE